MHADLAGALEQLNTCWMSFRHKGARLSKNQVREILVFGLSKGYKTTADLKDEEVDELLKQPKP